MDIPEIIQLLSEEAEPGYKDRLQNFGIRTQKAMGIRLPKLRALAKTIGKNQPLAIQLWREEWHEAKLLAIFLAEPKQFSEAELEEWAADFYSWDLVDQACTIFAQHPLAFQKAEEWRHQEPEFQKRAGIVMMVAISIHRKKIPDAELLPFFDCIREAACDDRNFVKKAVNWLLRQMGKRSLFLHPHAVACAESLLELGCPSANWIARDALRELKSDSVWTRLQDKEKRKKK